MECELNVMKQGFLSMTDHSRCFPYLLICLSVLVVYLPSFTGEFILDDHPLIQNNSYIKEWHSIGSYLFQEDGVDSNSGNRHTGYYRPLLNLSYTLDYKIWGISGPGFRITNLILHLLVCFALFILYNMILERTEIALWLTLIFSLHPVITETVSWAASRNNILVTLFGILCLFFYIKAYRSQKFFFYILSILFFMLSVFSKEFGLMLLPIFFIYQRLLNTQKSDLIKELREYLPYLIISTGYFILRQNVTGTLLSPNGLPDVFMRIYNLPYVLLLNLRLIFFPYNLHSYITTMPEGFVNVGTLSGIVFFMAGIYLLWRFRGNHFLLFSCLAFFLAIFPVAGIIPTSAPSLISMRWLYFPMIFILLILAQPLERIFKSMGRTACYIMVCIVFYLGINAFILNKHFWHSQESFFTQEVLHFKNKYASDGLAQIYFSQGKFNLAERYFEIGLKDGPKRALDYIEYSTILIEKGESKKALSCLEEAEYSWPTVSELGMIHNHRGLAYMDIKDWGRAFVELKKAILLIPDSDLIWENMGVAYGEMGSHAKAVDSFKKAIRFQSKSDGIYDNLALSYILNNECQKAVSLLDRKGYREKDKAKELLKRARKCLKSDG
jgi:protein O-mannosyl-transferase